VTLNGLIGLILGFSPQNSIALLANYVTVYVRQILSPRSSLSLLIKTNPPCSVVSLRWLNYLSYL